MKQNVIFLMTDQHRAMSMGSYGSTEVLTPNLDRLAKRSVQFDRAYCQYPQCVGSRQSLLTGQYPSRHGTWGTNLAGIDPGQWTIQHAFRQAGYKTVMIGHPHANERGFEDNRNSGTWYEHQPQSVKDVVKGQFFGFDYLQNARTAAPLAFPEEYMLDDFIWKETVKFLGEPQDRPFFLWVTFPKPHPPFNPPQRFWDLYDHEAIRLPPIDPNPLEDPFWKPDITTDEMKRNYLHGYYACITYVDWCLGNILEAMEKGGYFGNSIIAYTSDHGESGGYHGGYEKHCFYEPAIRVPLLIRDPAVAPRRVGQIVEIMDLVPTFTELCGIPVDAAQFDGPSLAGLMRGHTAGWRNRAISEYYQEYRLPDGTLDVERSFGRMLIEDNYKCCIQGNMRHPYSLYDMDKDTEEIRNLWDEPSLRDRRDRMVAELRRDWRREWYPYTA